MRRRLWIRHLIVAAVVAVFGFLGARGIIGEINTSRIDQWQVVARRDPAGGLRITEVIDLDLADDPGHGLSLATGTEFGRPQDLEASSPDAPADVSSSEDAGELLTRIGDPDVEIVGQHRYEVSYTLPNAPLRPGNLLSLDVMVGSSLDTDEFRATLVGFELDNPTCYQGKRDSSPCSIAARPSGGYEVHLFDLDSGTDVTIEGEIIDLASESSVSIAEPPPRRAHPDQRLGGLATGGAAFVGALLSYLWCRGRGRNRVVGDGGAADAAAIISTPSSAAGVPTTAVSDARLASMATIEFEPPPQIAPWEGLVLVTERFIKPQVFTAYLSGLAGAGAIEIAPAGKGVAISAGPNLDQTPPEDRRYIDSILSIQNPYVTGKFNPRFNAVYKSVRYDLHQRLVSRGWWSRGTPRQRMGVLDRTLLNLFISVFAVGLLFIPALVLGLFMHLFLWLAVVVSFFVGLIVARVAYRILLPSRTAAGSALALRTESFRRFLDASEAPQVEWAWEHDVLREYSGWAVALGEASAWSAAIEKAAQSQPSVASVGSGPILVYSHRGSISRSMTFVSSGGGGRSGGSSSSRGSSGGGRSGGGGGGSRAGRW